MNFRHDFNEVFGVEVPIAIAVMVIICAIVAFTAIRYRAGRGHEPSKVAKHPVAEPLYVVALVIIALGLSIFVAHVNGQERSGLGKPQLSVKVVGFQWCWSFHYEHTPVTVTGTCLTKSQDPTLMLPVGENVRINLTSNDVVHEFWVPYFRFKIEAFPHHTNSFDVKVTHPGNWVGRCSVFCGVFHYRMDFRVKAVSAQAFDSWLHTQRAAVRSAA